MLQCAFEERSMHYWQEHPQELFDTLDGVDEWDGWLWHNAVRTLQKGEWYSFIKWVLHDVVETHMQDQMLMLIKEVAPRAFDELGIETP